MEQSKKAKYCFNLPNNTSMLCFNKLAGEQTLKNTLKNVHFVEYIFKTHKQMLKAFSYIFI